MPTLLALITSESTRFKKFHFPFEKLIHCSRLDLAVGRQQADVHQFVQDEAVCDPWRDPHALWHCSWPLQPPVCVSYCTLSECERYNRHFRRYMNVYFEFIPQVLFLTCIFGKLGGFLFSLYFYWRLNCRLPCGHDFLQMVVQLELPDVPQPAKSAADAHQHVPQLQHAA